MADPAELTHEHLRFLLLCEAGALPVPMAPGLQEWVRDMTHQDALVHYTVPPSIGLRCGGYFLTPRGRELVDIALRAVNAELRSK